jgi:uncharacterized protein
VLDQRTPEQQAVAMIAAARGYNKREDKPYWWGHFHRMDYPIDEWADTSGVFMIGHPDVEEDWSEPQGKKRKHRRRLVLRGALESGNLNSMKMRAIYDAPAPAALDHHPNGRACHDVEIVAFDDPVEPTQLTVIELGVGKDDETHPQLPFALTPQQPVQTTHIKAAIDAGIKFGDIFDAVKPDPVNGSCPTGYTSINAGHDTYQPYPGHQCLKLKTGKFAKVSIEKLASRLESRRYAAMMGATTAVP